MKPDHIRTLAILKNLSKGQQLTIPNIGTIAMAEDMSIGFIAKDADGNEFIMNLSTINLAQLNKMLNDHKIGMAQGALS